MTDLPSSSADDGERIAKVLARAGVCSRRDAEKLIAEGRVMVAGRVLDTPAVKVTPGQDILVDGQPIPEIAPARLWRFHKPPGLVTSHRDPQGRPTVFTALPATLPRVISVGRLDVTSEGLLLLTNDGALARRLELPSTGWLRRYRVRVFGRVEDKDLERLQDGVEIEGVRYRAASARLDRVQGGNAWLTVGIREGKNREVRKLMDYLGLTVNRLIRISYGPFQLGDLAARGVEEVPAKVLREQLGTSKDSTARTRRASSTVSKAQRTTKAAPGQTRSVSSPRKGNPKGR